MKYLAYNSPVFGETNLNEIILMKEEDAILLWKINHPEYPYTDKEALQDYMTVYWAWYVSVTPLTVPTGLESWVEGPKQEDSEECPL